MAQSRRISRSSIAALSSADDRGTWVLLTVPLLHNTTLNSLLPQQSGVYGFMAPARMPCLPSLPP
jgi:hypothetical protein